MTKFQALNAINNQTAAVSGAYYMITSFDPHYPLALQVLVVDGKQIAYSCPLDFVPTDNWRLIPRQEAELVPLFMTRREATLAIDSQTAAVSGAYYMVQFPGRIGFIMTYRLVTIEGKVSLENIVYNYLPWEDWRLVPLADLNDLFLSRQNA